MMYKVGDGEWSEEIPEATEAGEYTVSYKVVRAEGHGETDVQQLKVTIAPAKRMIQRRMIQRATPEINQMEKMIHRIQIRTVTQIITTKTVIQIRLL